MFFVRRNSLPLLVRCGLLAVLLPASITAPPVRADGAAPTTIVIVRSGDAAPYQKAEAAIERHAKAQGVACTRFAYDGADAEVPPRIRDIPSNRFIAIGSRAAIRLARDLPSGTPLFYCLASERAAQQLRKRPSTSGITMQVPIEGQFAILSRCLPRARRIGMLYRSEKDVSRKSLTAARAALPDGWTLEAVDVDQYDSFARAQEALFQKKVDCVWTALDPHVCTSANVRSLLLSGLRQKVPVFGFSIEVVRAGALVGVGIDPTVHGTRCAALTVADPFPSGGDTPSDGSVPFDIAINLVIAKRIGIKVPSNLVDDAKHVIRSEKRKP